MKQTTEEVFIQSMRAVIKSGKASEAMAYVHGWRYNGPPNPIRSACEAWADNVCDLRDVMSDCFLAAGAEFRSGGGGKSTDFTALIDGQHKRCRAQILKAVFGTDDPK